MRSHGVGGRRWRVWRGWSRSQTRVLRQSCLWGGEVGRAAGEGQVQLFDRPEETLVGYTDVLVWISLLGRRDVAGVEFKDGSAE